MKGKRRKVTETNEEKYIFSFEESNFVIDKKKFLKNKNGSTVLPFNNSKENLEPLNVINQGISYQPDTKSSPVIGYFPSGYDPLKNSNDPDSESGPNASVKVYRSVNSRNPKNTRMQVVVGASGSLVNFVGTNYSGEATTPQLCSYTLGVLDKETGVLKMVPIAANRGPIEISSKKPISRLREVILYKG
ncbi:hypothetical protein CASFOL_032342 [Castilleja foliolosa]|uniref:Uncharacterized protein n=1 Tax=Castilleja foliolosa TaxID=1961234 RepID=A0ABD3C189_9LAMI